MRTTLAPAALDAGPQPGARAPAPGHLALVQAFVNSSYDLEREHGGELLPSPEALRRWLRRRRLIARDARAGEAELSAALAVREGLRALLVENNGGAPDRRALAAMDAAAGPVTVALAHGQPEFAAAAQDVGGALGLIVTVAARAMLDGSWPRFKACRMHDCRWAFYDHSRNGAGAWCSMAVCGGRAKQRAYYRRHAGVVS